MSYMYLTQSLLLLAHSGQDSVVRSIVELQISLDTTCDYHTKHQIIIATATKSIDHHSNY
jgi:hypothetical protein